MTNEKPSSTPLQQPTPEEWREGKKRAVALLRDLEEIPSGETDYQNDGRDGRPQQNVVYTHLFALLTTRNQGVYIAFSSALTHFLGNVMHIGVQDLPVFSRELRRPIPVDWAREANAPVSMNGFQ